MKSYITLYVLGFAILFYSCSKENMNEDGWNVMEWTVEGKTYKAQCGGPITSCSWASCTTRPCDPVYTYFDYEYGTLYIRGRNSTYVDLHKEGDLNLNSRNIIGESDKMIFHNPSLDSCKSYYVDTSISYNLLITTLDTANRLMSGVFSFTAISDCQDTVRLKDGYFKLDY